MRNKKQIAVVEWDLGLMRDVDDDPCRQPGFFVEMTTGPELISALRRTCARGWRSVKSDVFEPVDLTSLM